MSRDSSGMDILGVRVDDISRQGAIDFILKSAAERKKALIVYINVHAVNLAYDDVRLRAFINGCDMVFCDGFGVKLAAWILHRRRIERFTPPDWLPELAARCAEMNLSIFLLGSRPGTAEKAAAKLTQAAPAFRPAGFFHGFFNKHTSSVENKEVVERINIANPDLLLVGFGMPLQERWIEENRPALNAPVIMTVGAAFDYLAGEVRRAPGWATGHGLEWLGRLLVEPRRLWRRYIIGNPLFFWRVILSKMGWLEKSNDRENS